METRPLAACVAIVHDVLPASHIRFATVQVLASPTLAKVEGVLPEETSTICDLIRDMASATCANNNPSIASIGTMVPEKHPSMATTLKHLKSHQTPSSAHVWSGLSIAPAMQAIVVDCVPIVNPQFAAIIRDNAEMVMACLEDSQAARPTHSEVIASGKTRPLTSCVAIVYHLAEHNKNCWRRVLEELVSCAS